MSDTDQPRRVAGTPSGGQYAPVTHPEPDVALQVDAQPEDGDSTAGNNAAIDEFEAWAENYNKSGTFAFPPQANDPVQVQRFWENVPIPDVVLAQFQAAYPPARERKINRIVNELMANDPAPVEPLLGKTKKYKAELEEWEDRRRQATEEALRHCGPGDLPAEYVRYCVQRVMMGRQLRKLGADVHNAEYDVTAGEMLASDTRCRWTPGGRPVSLADFDGFFAVEEMPASVFRDPSIDSASQMAAMNRTLQAMSGEIQAMRDEAELTHISQAARNGREFNRMAGQAGFEH